MPFETPCRNREIAQKRRGRMKCVLRSFFFSHPSVRRASSSIVSHSKTCGSDRRLREEFEKKPSGSTRVVANVSQTALGLRALAEEAMVTVNVRTEGMSFSCPAPSTSLLPSTRSQSKAEGMKLALEAWRSKDAACCSHCVGDYRCLQNDNWPFMFQKVPFRVTSPSVPMPYGSCRLATLFRCFASLPLSLAQSLRRTAFRTPCVHCRCLPGRKGF